MKRAMLFAAMFLTTVFPCAAQDQPQLGRLFFSAEQRAALDARRRARVPDQPGAAAAVVASPTTRLDGYVKRSGGKSTVWLNGQPIPEAALDAPRISASGDPRVSVPVGESRTRVGLKPGETLDRGSGAVRDVIGDGEIKVRPGK
jgi:hypothetical protein